MRPPWRAAWWCRSGSPRSPPSRRSAPRRRARPSRAPSRGDRSCLRRSCAAGCGGSWPSARGRLRRHISRRSRTSRRTRRSPGRRWRRRSPCRRGSNLPNAGRGSGWPGAPGRPPRACPPARGWPSAPRRSEAGWAHPPCPAAGSRGRAAAPPPAAPPCRAGDPQAGCRPDARSATRRASACRGGWRRPRTAGPRRAPPGGRRGACACGHRRRGSSASSSARDRRALQASRPAR